jgi:hypothetical protein
MSKQSAYILTDPNPGKHLYGRGWLGLIPLIGAFVGLGLISLGLFKYRDRKLVFIGIAAILFTVLVYGSLFIYINSDSARKQWSSVVPEQLNSLVRDIEFYKIQNGQYPDSLEELLQNNKLLLIDDPLSAKAFGQKKKYNYRKANNHYILFSSGIDRIENTDDDIFPSVDTAKTGLIKSSILNDGR